MPLGTVADILMYAPFVGVYSVPDDVSRKLTTDAFFGKDGCYVHPDFDKKIRMIIKKSNPVSDDNMTGEDWAVDVSELLDSLDRGKKDQAELNKWLKNSSDGIFKILGDAGTGKSTFLHHLKWSRRDITWHILDLKKAIPKIKIFGSSINIPREYFVSLHGKVLSTVILEIRDYLFEKTNGEYDFVQCRMKLQELLRRYDLHIVGKFPLEEYAELYENLSKIQFQAGDSRKDIDYCRACANVITKYFEEKCFVQHRSRDSEASALRCALTQLLIVLRCFREKCQKHVVVFDNIERFIGADEIYNKELTDFLNDMRNFCDNYSNEYFIEETNTDRFAQNYQFIVSMRNTTVRNHTPAEIADFTRHSIDLSSWFAIGDIIHAKLDWYNRHQIRVLDENSEKHLEYILSDDGISVKGTFSGLRPKLDLIFNYNKRLIITFLTDELLVSSAKNRAHYLASADFFHKNMFDKESPQRLTSFGYRSVIWRSVLDWLRRSDLFQEEILTKYETTKGRISDTNYVWRILVVLHRFSAAHGGRETESRGTEQYMPFLDLIQKVYNEHGNFSSRFYENGFSEERERMARLLHYLNRYDRNENNWFHLVDIQYNVDQANRRNLESWEVLHESFLEAKTSPEKLRIRITTAGKAYLRYVAPSFEFVSCVAGKLPLFCCLPTETQLERHHAEKQKCMQIIRDTLQEIRDYISDLQSDNPNLLYQPTRDISGQPYADRIVKSTYGYLTNFVDCIDRLVIVTSEEAEKTKRKLIQLVVSEANSLWNAYLPPRPQ